MLALRAHVLALGYSGVRVEIANRFVELLRHDILPVVPEQGSLGASGDLAPLAHLALGAVGEGEVHYAGERMPAADALRRAVRNNRKTFLETVDRLRGKAEMHFKLLVKDGTLQEAVAELPASPIEKGLAAPGLLAAVIVGKYTDHMPLNRMEKSLARHGIDIPAPPKQQTPPQNPR